MNVPALLAAAEALLDEPDATTDSVWPLGAAVLTRQAVEATVDLFWGQTVPDMRWATMADRWLSLPAYLGRKPEIAAAEHAWHALSRACHGNAYDVGLTQDELRAHLAAAKAFAVLVFAAVVRTEAAAATPSV